MAQSYRYPAVVVAAPAAGLDVNIHDAAGNNLTSTGGALDVNASNPSIGSNNSAAPGSSTQIGAQFSGNLVPLQANASGELLTSSVAAANLGGSNVDTTVDTSGATLTAPANAMGFILMNLDTSSASVRWCIGATAGVASGQQLQVARDSGFVPCGADISICAESGTQNFNIQWVLSS